MLSTNMYTRHIGADLKKIHIKCLLPLAKSIDEKEKHKKFFISDTNLNTN